MADPGTPSLHSPRDGAAVDGMACTLSWQSVPGSTYRVQISANDRFDALIVDADTEDATALTLYEILPRDGRRLHWRVATHKSGATGSWSESAWFLAADVEDRPPPRPTTRSVGQRAPLAAQTSSPGAEPVPLYLQETTGLREVLVAFAVLIFTLILLLVVAF